MTLERARILKKAENADVLVSAARESHPRDLAPPLVVARRVPRAVAEASIEAARIVSDAKAQATKVLEEAHATAVNLANVAANEACARELARITADILAVRALEERSAERELGRTLEIAVLLAERLLGEALHVAPARMMNLALAALKETRGAREIRLAICPDDAPALTELVAALGEGAVVLERSPELSRGSLVVHTELGAIDARLPLQLGRLAEALREVLANDPSKNEPDAAPK